MKPHRLVAGGYDPNRGALYLWCACGHEELAYPPSHAWFDGALVDLEREQVERFRRHVEAGR